jgi:hypothetical protein
MTEQQARTTANVVMVAGAVGAVVYVLTKPPLRRLAVQLARSWVKGPLAVWALAELRRAWLESGQDLHGHAPTGASGLASRLLPAESPR